MSARVAILVVTALVAAARAGDGALDAARFDQRLGEAVDGTLRFTNDRGEEVRLDACFGADGRPVILTLAYYRCPMLCPMVLDGMVRSFQELPFTAGREYRWVVVSIDPEETPEDARRMRRTLAARETRGGAESGWHLLTGGPDAIERLASQVGFRYARDERTGQFAHPAGVVVLTGDGGVSKYFFGTSFDPDDLRLGLVDASEGRVGSLADRLLLRCYHYDPRTGRYGFAVMSAVRAGGALAVLALGGLVGWLLRRERRGSAP